MFKKEIVIKGLKDITRRIFNVEYIYIISL